MKEPGDMTHFLDFSNEGGGIRYFDQLYRQYHQAVFANILKMVRLTDIAEDILQEVFMALWVNHKGIEAGRVANWLFVVSHNKSLSYLKNASRYYAAAGQRADEMEHLAEETGINEEEFEWKQTMIKKAIEELPERKKDIFLRYRLKGASLEEIAADLNISVHTVKDHLKIANRLIKGYISNNYNVHFSSEALLLAVYFLC